MTSMSVMQRFDQSQPLDGILLAIIRAALLAASNEAQMHEIRPPLHCFSWVTGSVYTERIHPLPLASIDDLTQADGVILGSGTRYRGMSAALKYFLEKASPLWRTNALLGRPAGVMAVASTPHGGVEQAALGMMMQLMHLGMLIVPCGYATPLLQRAGSPYGAMAIAGGAAAAPSQKMTCLSLITWDCGWLK